jgi:ATP dependent DNA ligase domain
MLVVNWFTPLRREMRPDRAIHSGIRRQGPLSPEGPTVLPVKHVPNPARRLCAASPSRRRAAVHFALRALWVNGRDLRGLPLTQRERALHGLVSATTTVVSQVFSIVERGRDLFDAAERLDLEGIVAKRKADPYRPETVWYRIKSRTYTQGEGRWELFQRR